MSDATDDSVRRCFDEALVLDPDRREVFLNNEIGDENVRREVRSLLEAYEEAGDYLEQPPAATTVSVDEIARWVNPDAQLVGETIGRCRLQRVIASGGMGTVFEAEQEEPRRTVAVKLLRRGLVSDKSSQRFEYETQVLAKLHHPGIAQIYEAGSHEGGGNEVPYFVMEYITDAKSLTKFATWKGLSLHKRVELFIEVCQAVHYGHLQGVIHRDLKPENILVDEEGRPRIIDFGVAKATDGDLASTTRVTEAGQLIGTLQYMSPEQCGGDANMIDFRSDVYSLGVVLYELLSGRLPYSIGDATPAEAIRVVRESTAALPSKFNRALRGDLDKIILKSLAKERERRYDSGAALAADLHRYLNDEPIAARPPSAMYQIRKLARRNTGLVVGTLTAALALIIGTGAAIWKNVQLSDALDDLSASNQLLMEQEQVAVDAQGIAERRAESLEQVNGLIDDILQGATPEESGGEEFTVAQMLEAATEKIKQEPPEDMLVAASMHHFLGNAFLGLGRLAEAETHFRRTLTIRTELLGGDSKEATAVKGGLARVLSIQSSHEEAEVLARESLAYANRTYGPEHDETLTSMNNLSLVLVSAGKEDEGLEFIRTVLETRRRDGSDISAALHNYALALSESGRYLEALPVLQESLEATIAMKGERDPMTATGRFNLAYGYMDLGRYEEAEREVRIAVDIALEMYGPDDWRTNTMKDTLGAAVMRQGRTEEAEVIIREVYETSKRLFGPEHPRTLNKLQSLGVLIQQTDHWRDAEAIFRQLVDTNERVLGEQDQLLASSLQSLAVQLMDQDELEEAESIIKRAIDLHSKYRGPAHPFTLIGWHNYGDLLVRLRREDEAIEVMTNTLQRRIEVLGDGHPNTRLTRMNLADFVRSQRKWSESIPLYKAQLEADRELRPHDYATLDLTNTLGVMNLFIDDPATASPLLEEGWRGMVEHFPEDESTIALHRNNFGRSLLLLDRFDEAEDHIFAAYEMCETLFPPGHSRIISPMRNLIELYERSDRREMALPWHRELLSIAIGRIQSEDAGAGAVNRVAWDLLTYEYEELRDPPLALELAHRANELSGGDHPSILDTLALALFQTGDVQGAVETQRRATELSPDDEGLRATLERYEAALNSRSEAASKP